MSSRVHKDWIAAYMKYTDNTESAKIFHRWAAYSAIAAVLRRKVHFNFGRIKLYPNLFIVLVADPGIARKTQAISFMEDILHNIYGIHTSADSVTPQALLEDIESASTTDVLEDSSSIQHSSLTIVSGEFESFLGSKKDNSKMIVTLTDLYDCKARPFKYRTKHSGSNTIPLPYLNMIAATTPESLANCLPSIAIGGGLTSRIQFIFSDKKEKKVPIPEYTAGIEQLYEDLVRDLSVIARISGGYNYSKEGKDWWYDFYNNFDERDPNRICKDHALLGWYSRKPISILKLATVITAARTNEREISVEALQEANKRVEEIERTMGNAFSAVGRSDITSDVDMLRKILERYKSISEKSLRRMVWRDIDSKKFENVIDTIVKGGDAVRKFKDPTEKKQEIWYHWRGEVK